MKSTSRQFQLLCLGDSYTIGEALPLHQNFPYQAVQLLRKRQLDFSAPEILAKTGWTTDELAAAVKEHKFLQQYHFATLLIGVNNQYRGRNAIEYKIEFEELLAKAIELCGGKAAHVFVLSIPDYSLTPFAGQLDREKIAREIDVFNSINKAVSIQYKAQYVNITEKMRKEKDQAVLIANDQLHPSAFAYANWAKSLATAITKQIK